MFDNINEFYESILATGALKPNDQGRILVVHDPANPTPAKVLEKELILPTKDNLRNRDYERDTFFHPLSENIQRGESDVFKYLKKNVLMRLGSTITYVGMVLLKLQEDPARQRSMTEEQRDLMLPISTAYATSSKNFVKMATHYMRTDKDDQKKSLLSTFMKKSGIYHGVTFRRVAVVSFPLYEYIKQGGRLTTGEGSKAKDIARTADYATFQQVMKSIFPGIDNLEDYNHAYDGMLSPILIAFYRSVGKLVERANYVIDVIEPLAKEISMDVSPGRIPMDWLGIFEDEHKDKLASWKRSVPNLAGNEGDVNETDSRDGEPVYRTPEPERQEKKIDVVVPERKKEEPREEEPIRRPQADNKFGIVATWASSTHKGTVQNRAEEERLREEQEREREERERERYRSRRDDRDVRRPPSDRDNDIERNKDGRLNFAAELAKDPYEQELKRRRERERYDYEDDRGYRGDRRDRYGRDDRGHRYREDDRRDRYGRGDRDYDDDRRDRYGRDRREDRYSRDDRYERGRSRY